MVYLTTLTNSSVGLPQGMSWLRKSFSTIRGSTDWWRYNAVVLCALIIGLTFSTMYAKRLVCQFIASSRSLKVYRARRMNEVPIRFRVGFIE